MRTRQKTVASMTAANDEKPQETNQPGAEAAAEANDQDAAAQDEDGQAAESEAQTADSAGQSEAERIRELEKEAESLREQALRARAEVENVLRRTQREKEDIANYAISDFARALLPVADNLRRALEAVPQEAEENQHVKTLLEGVEMTEKEFLSALEKHGIEKVAPEKGEPFDHNYHQAMTEADAPDQKPGTVVDVFQPGYIIKDRLLRPAMVTVAKKDSGKNEGESVDTTA